MPIKNGFILQTKEGDWKAVLSNLVTVKKTGRKYYLVINKYSISISVIDALEILSRGRNLLTFSDGSALLLEPLNEVAPPKDC